MMNLKTFVEEHKGVRRVLLAINVIWNTVVIFGGVYKSIWGDGITNYDVVFYGTVTAMMTAVSGFYFWRSPS